MTDKLKDKIRQVEDEHAGEILDSRIAAHADREKQTSVFILGGIRVADRIAASLSSEAMRALLRFQEEERYKTLGFATMVDFLNESELSPMTKHQFYDRKALLEKEGDQVFNLLNDLGVSVRQRKLLGKGNVQIDGETVLVTTDGEETAIELTDRTRILETLTALADANADKTKKLDKQKSQLESADVKIGELYNEVDRARAAAAAGIEQDPHSIAIVNLTFAYHAVMDTVGDMNEVEREQFAPRDFSLIADLMADLAAAYGRGDWTKIAPSGSKPTGDDIDSVISSALDEDDNDSELAKSL